MTEPIAFNSYLGWVNVADPANIPADVRIISAEDLLRYENFGDAARTAVNELITTTGDHETRLDTAEETLAGLSTAVGALTGLTGARITAAKGFDLTAAGGAKTLATVAGGSNYAAFELEVTLVGRTAAGALYAKALRYVRPENGNPQYVTVGADTLSGPVTLAFAAAGTDGVSVSATVSADAFITAHIKALAGAGSTAGAARTVTVAMA